MITKLLLIRHGETSWNALGKFQGSQNIDLSEEGIIQAKYLEKRLRNSFDCMYCSPLKRAYETADIICENINIKPIIKEGIKEIDFGKWEGLTVKQIEELYPNEFKIWTTDREKAPLCGGNDGSIKFASARAKKCLIDLVNENRGKTIAVVAHGGIIKASLIGLLEWDMTMYHKISLGNTAICELHFNDKNEVKIVTINDTSHLPQNYKIKSYV